MKTLTCKNCKEEIQYNFYYQCYDCNCGKVYNAGGQELRPIEDWKDEYEEDYY